MSWDLYCISATAPSPGTKLASYEQEEGAFNALLEVASFELTGYDAAQRPTTGFTWTDDGKYTTDGTVRFERKYAGEFCYVQCGTDVYTTDSFDVVKGDLRQQTVVEVVYPKVAVERSKKLVAELVELHTQHTAAAEGWIKGWREAQEELPVEKRVDKCPFMELLPALPVVRTNLGLQAHKNKLLADLKWISKNPPGLPVPEEAVAKAQKWKMRSPGFWQKVKPE